MNDKCYFPELDATKGIAIILMILGHCIQLSYVSDEGFFENIVFKLIYSFHMPLFMIISGFLFAGTVERKSLLQIIYSKVTNILFPILIWNFIVEFIIQKAAELGASEVVPVAMKNCVAKLDAKKAESKKKRWQSIAESAAKQSKRSVIPAVGDVISFSEAVKAAGAFDVGLVCYENERGMAGTRARIEAIRPGQSVAVFIGPEGGFDASEIALAKEAGMHTVSLGNRILRTETAGLAILSVLMYQIESAVGG